MSFYSPVFLFAFLPLTVILYHLARKTKLQSIIWIASGLLFYAFGDLRHLPLLLLSCAVHYGVGRYLMAARRARGVVLGLCIVADLAVLAFFKIKGALPLGISFYTFQAISYVADTYREVANGTKSLGELLQYLTFFPQLTAGPFLKFSALRPFLDTREESWETGAQGAQRFVCGLCKKLLVSSAAAEIADVMFGLTSIDALGAWVGALCYCVQLYFDFSGYSDMALGLGMMFGVSLPENFRYPYGAGSVSEFWRRWHMTLSGWFRDYLYIPLGGSRKGTVRTICNKLLVFLATGLWHGTGWTFVLWGLWHGLFCSLETAFDRKKRLAQHWYGHLYTLLVVIVGFVLFRAGSLLQAGTMLRAMLAGFAPIDACRLALCNVLTQGRIFWCVVGAAGSLPIWPLAQKKLAGKRGFWAALDVMAIIGLLLCMMQLASNSFQPFIYAGF